MFKFISIQTFEMSFVSFWAISLHVPTQEIVLLLHARTHLVAVSILEIVLRMYYLAVESIASRAFDRNVKHLAEFLWLRRVEFVPQDWFSFDRCIRFGRIDREYSPLLGTSTRPGHHLSMILISPDIEFPTERSSFRVSYDPPLVTFAEYFPLNAFSCRLLHIALRMAQLWLWTQENVWKYFSFEDRKQKSKR